MIYFFLIAITKPNFFLQKIYIIKNENFLFHPMQTEYNISGRIILPTGVKQILLSEILVFAKETLEERVSENILVAYCRQLSLQFQCKVCLWKTKEEYGNLNVFNGGSDFDVINEECFLCIYENGVEILQEKTPCWNNRIDKVLFEGN